MNLKTELKNLKGETMHVAYPSPSEIEKVAKDLGKKVEEVQVSEMPKETYEGMLINILSAYIATDPREMFSVQAIATWVMSGSESPLPEKLVTFLKEKALPQAVKREESVKGVKVSKGLYYAWAVASLCQALDITE